MELHRQLADSLEKYRQINPKLKEWRFDLHQIQGIDIGVKNNKIGGPYSAPSFKRSISGEIYLIWAGNWYTSAKLDAQVIANFPDYIDLWEKTAYHDPDGVGLFSPDRLPEMPLADRQVERIVASDYQKALELLDRGLKQLIEAGIKKVDAGVRCYRDTRYLINSQGWEANYSQTPAEIYFVANDSYGESFSEKKWPDAAEIQSIIAATVKIGTLLEKDAACRLAGPVKLIFPPETLELFLNHFLLTNLYGGLIVNRQSRYTLEDFQKQRPTLRPDLTLTVNNLLPYRAFSYRCTAEGVPGGVRELITGGRLQTPILNLKYARKTGLKPTAAVVGGRGFFLSGSYPRRDWDDLIKETERGLIVYSVLGMHTQDSIAGRFSVTADQCLLVEDGELKGKVKAVLNGDFLESLTKEENLFCRMAGEDNPGFIFTANAISIR